MYWCFLACGPKTVSRKTHVFEYRDCGVEWGGVGGMLTFLVLRAWYIAMLLRSLGSFTTLHVATLLMGWGGVGVGCGVMLTFLVLRTWYIAMLLRSLGLFTTLHVGYAAEISGIVYYLWDRLLRYMLLRCWDLCGIVYYVTCCYAAEISGIVYYVTCSMWNLMKKSITSNLSAKSDLLMVYARAWQWRCIHKNADCQLITVHALQR